MLCFMLNLISTQSVSYDHIHMSLHSLSINCIPLHGHWLILANLLSDVQPDYLNISRMVLTIVSC